MIARLVVDCDFNLVCLVNAEIMDFVGPAIVPGRLGAALDCVFNLDVDKGFRASTKAPSSCVVNISDSVYAERQLATQGFPLAGDIETIVCTMVSLYAKRMLLARFNLLSSPSPSMSTCRSS